MWGWGGRGRQHAPHKVSQRLHLDIEVADSQLPQLKHDLHQAPLHEGGHAAQPVGRGLGGVRAARQRHQQCQGMLEQLQVHGAVAVLHLKQAQQSSQVLARHLHL